MSGDGRRPLQQLRAAGLPAVTGPAPGDPPGRERMRWLLPELAIAVGGLCVALHVALGVAPGHGDPLHRAVLLGMAAACVPCLRALRLGPTPRVWAMTGGMYAAMLGAHLLLLAAPWASGSAGHVHVAGPSWTDVGMWAGLALAGAQLGLAAVVLVARVGTLTAPRTSSP